MKKFTLPTLLCVLTLSFFSCSTENNDATTTENALTNSSVFQTKSLNSTDLGAAKQLYIDMMGTQEYVDLRSSTRAFVDKLSNKISFRNKSEAMDWILVNISSTLFTNVTDFETMYDDSVYKMDILVSKNKTLFDYLKGADANQLGIIMSPEQGDLPDYPVSPTSCIEDCMGAHGVAIEAAWNNYCAAADSATNGMPGMFDGVILYFAMERYLDAEVELANQYTNCAGAC